MTHRLTTIYAKNYCNRTLIVKVIVENVVTCFFGTRCIIMLPFNNNNNNNAAAVGGSPTGKCGLLPQHFHHRVNDVVVLLA